MPALIALERDDTAGAALLADTARQVLGERASSYGADWMPWLHGLLAHARGEDDVARSALLAMWDAVDALHYHWIHRVIGPDLGRLQVSGGDLESARHIADRLAGDLCVQLGAVRTQRRVEAALRKLGNMGRDGDHNRALPTAGTA